MLDLIRALNAHLVNVGECVAITRQADAETHHYTAHLHLAALSVRERDAALLADFMASQGCYGIVVAQVLHDAVNNTRAGHTDEGARHWCISFQRDDEPTRARALRVLAFVTGPRGAHVDHVTAADLIELTGIAPEHRTVRLLRAVTGALMQAGWAQYRARCQGGGSATWLYKRPLPAPTAPAAAAVAGQAAARAD